MIKTCKYIWLYLSLIRLLTNILEYGDYWGGPNYHKSLTGERGRVESEKKKNATVEAASRWKKNPLVCLKIEERKLQAEDCAWFPEVENGRKWIGLRHLAGGGGSDNTLILAQGICQAYGVKKYVLLERPLCLWYFGALWKPSTPSDTCEILFKVAEPLSIPTSPVVLHPCQHLV